MKNLKSIFVIALAMLSLSVAKADNYTECIKALMQSNSTTFNADFGKQILGQSGIDVANISKDNIVDCLVEAMAPYFKKNLSEAEIAEAVKYVQKPEVKAINEKVQKAIEQGSQKSQEKIKPIVMNLMFGDTPENVPMPECDAEYISTFDTFYKASGLEDIAQMLGNVMQMSMNNAPESQKEMISKLVSRLTTYLADNMKPLMLGIMKEELTLSDLQEYNKVNDNDIMRKMNAVSKELVSDIANFSESLTSIAGNKLK